MILVDLNKRLENLIQTDSDFCFCGSGKLYKDCCKDKDKPDWVNDDIIKSIDKYDNKPDFAIFHNFQKQFWEKSQCIISGCADVAIDSHIISLHKLKEGGEGSFLYHNSLPEKEEYKKIGIKTISKKVWCNNHDKLLFKEIDKKYFDFYRNENQIEKFTLEYAYRVLGYAKRQLDSFLKYTYLLQLTQKEKLIKSIWPDGKVRNYLEYNLINKVCKNLEREILEGIYETRNIFVLKIESDKLLGTYGFYYDSKNGVVIILEAEKIAQYLYIISYDEFVNGMFRTNISKFYNEKKLESIINLIYPGFRSNWIDFLKANMKTGKSSCFLYA